MILSLQGLAFIIFGLNPNGITIYPLSNVKALFMLTLCVNAVIDALIIVYIVRVKWCTSFRRSVQCVY